MCTNISKSYNSSYAKLYKIDKGQVVQCFTYTKKAKLVVAIGGFEHLHHLLS